MEIGSEGPHMVHIRTPLFMAILMGLIAEVLGDPQTNPVEWAFGGLILGVVLEIWGTA